MANSKAPKHDFAPAWLKIPSNESLKPSGSKAAEHGDSGRARRDDFHGGFNRYGPSEYMYGPLPRQRSFENYYDDRHYSPQKFRHHSGDEDHFSPPYPYNSYGYNYNYENFNGHYRSQPTLSKYQHPNSRFGGQMNGAFPPPPPLPPHPPPPPHYYDPYYYDYYHNDPYYNNHMRGSNGGPRKRYSSGDKDSKSQVKADKDKDSKGHENDTDGKKMENLDEEFPSLNGDADGTESKPVKPVPSSGVWDKGPSAKLVNGKSSSSNGDSHSNISDGQSKDSSNRQQTSNMYKSLVPTKSTIRKGKDSGKLGTPGKDLNSNHSGSAKLPSASSPYKLVNNKDSNKETSCQSPSPPIDILNTRLVTTPKNLADKKSEFLKALREDRTLSTKTSDLNDKDISCSNSNEKNKNVARQSVLTNGAAPSLEEPMVNGINDLTITPIETALSSSLEAEQRLLKEMGWNEADDEEYVITEDEKREFEKLSKQLKEQRNGFKKTLPVAWSPQHISPYKPTADDSLSSLSEDSDLE